MSLFTGRQAHTFIHFSSSYVDISTANLSILILIFLYCRTDWLDGKHVVFGHVISGLDVLKKMEKYGSKGGSVTSKVTISNCGELQ